MPVLPVRNNAQSQPLTTALRIIIAEYPAGGGVLRELCQNADDAGATKVEFVLDTKLYETENILHPGLAGYQGPALLAFNDSTFSKTDFESLSRIGDSAKVNDLNATGKFGRGFNSVYNWTDMPSILSGESLLILDPHFTWSREVSPGDPGGPVYNFVEAFGEPEMRNQLTAFGSILTSFKNKFEGTIIRIPLRTEAQAVDSEIVPGKHTSETDIFDAFEKFSDELVESLLFLRNVCSITLRINENIYAKAVSTAQAKEIVNGGYKEVFVDQVKKICETDFLADISLYRGETADGYRTGKEGKFKYAISHYLGQGPEDEDLKTWARGQKLLPWIAIAAPLEGSTNFSGRLFSILPLPVHTKHPVHIHGMFSITPDRSNIHSGEDRAMSERSETKLGARWNTWLFQECVPHTWIRNLEFLDRMSENGEVRFTGWDFWPAGDQGGGRGIWMGVLSTLFRRVVGKNLKLLPTVCGNTGTRDDVLFTLAVDETYKNALQHARCPISAPPEDRRFELAGLRIEDLELTQLTPATARTSLSELRNSLGDLPLGFRMILLEYVLSDKNYESIGLCHAPLLPTPDGEFHSFSGANGSRLYFPRTKEEAEIFKKSARMVDTEKLNRKTGKQMKSDIRELDHLTAVSVWGVPDAVSYCKKYVFGDVKSQDIITRPDFKHFVNRFWEWISITENKKTLSAQPRLLDGLWLVPIMGDRYHKISDGKSILDISGCGPTSSFFQGAASRLFECYGGQYSLHTKEGITSTTTNLLRTYRYIQDQENFGAVIEWLVNNRTGFVDRLDDDEKNNLLTCLRILSIRFQGVTDNTQLVRKLRLFREVASTATPDRPWISLDSVRDNNPINYVGAKDIPMALSVPNTVFVDISNNDTEGLVRALGLVTFPSLKGILDLYVIPSIRDTKDDTLRAILVEFSFKHFNLLSDESKTKLANSKIVPVSTTETMFIRPLESVSTELAPFFFQGENRIPVPAFYRKYRSVLSSLGMVESISEAFAHERIETYSQPGRSPKDVGGKARRLIEHFTSIKNLPAKYLTFRWLPAKSHKGGDGLYSAEECRDQSMTLVAKYAMPLMTFQVSDSWRQALGWNEPLTKPQILKQLDEAVEVKDTEVLRYLILKGGENLMGDCISELQGREWIPDTLGAKYYRPADIFLGDFSCFSPYLSTVIQDFKISSCKDFLVKLGIKEEPSFRQLKELQENLATKGVLGEADLNVALCIVKEVGKRFSGEDLTDFKAPDNSGSLQLLKHLIAGDPSPEELEYFTADDSDLKEAKQAILHTGVSQDTIKQLRLPSFHDRLLEMLSDPDFDEGFTQKESFETVIKDTLRRYRPSSTFNEYLANAEDCRLATKVSWVLDHSEHYDGTELLVEKLREVQGPALFCCNDGVFTDKDFQAVIDIGVGSKGQDCSKIGKFGRGALTMYHWTSVPSFISGDSFVIFDPFLKYNLPVHPATRKPRAGMKLKLQDMRRKYPDQLRPFEGIFGFNKDTTSFRGTIFRFPLTRSGLIGNNIDHEKTPGQYLRDYFESAMDSLLFLERITSISFREINALSSSSDRPESSDGLIWKVSLEKVEVSEGPKIKKLTIKGQTKASGEEKHLSDEWCVISGGRDRGGLEKSLVKIQTKERLQAKYGLAASISKGADFCGRNYMSLPLVMPDTLEIPVHVDANLVVQSNRRSIPLADSEKEEGSEWNRWVFEKGVAPLYLDLVEYLMQTGVDGYSYWPPDPSSTTNAISQIISTAFWEKVVEPPYKLFPPMTLCSGGTPENLEFEAAIFDLLDSDSSEFFVNLLLQLELPNIVSPPPRIRGYLKVYNPASMRLVSPAYLLDLFSSLAYRNKLFRIWKEKYQYDIQFLNTLLSFIVSEAIQGSLIGCTLLPLANKNLGQLLSKTNAATTLIARAPEEQAILDISPDLAVHPGLEKSVIEKLLSMDELNIANFRFEDIPRLHKTAGEKSIDYRKDWVRNVWSYFEQCVREYPEKQESYLSILNDIPVYFGTPVGSDAQTIFLSPAELSAGSIAAIVEQSELTGPQISTLKLFKDLIILDPSAFPRSRLPFETMNGTSGVLGIYRLLRSIKILAGEKAIEEYIIETLQVDKLEALRQLLDPAVIGKLLRAYPDSMAYLKYLPIWPSESDQLSSYKPATKAILAPDYSISFASLTKKDPFIRASIAHTYSDELSGLGVRRMSLDELLKDHVHSGQKIEDSRIQSYGSFLFSLYRWDPSAFSQHPLAVNENGEHCILDSLYDIKNPIFCAAFRGMKALFLHPGLRDLSIWRDMGLRRETSFQSHYLDCVRSIEQRRKASSPIEDDQLIADAQTIFEYLSWDNQGMQSWNSNTWNIIYSNTAAPAQTRFGSNPEYRTPQMRSVLQNSNFTALSAAVIPEHTNIAWSQCPILKNKLGSFVLSRIPNNGLPPVDVVLRHLMYLSENRNRVAQQEIPAYSSDVKACYEHLQGRISSLPPPDRKAKIWLNVEAADIISLSESTFQSSWTCSELLCSGLKSDSMQIQYVRSSLIPFANLLDYYRVEKYFPSEEIKPPTPSTDYSAVILSEFQGHRHGGAFLDVTLDVGGKELEAHRIVLASASKYWERMLTGGFKEAGERKIPLPELKPRTVAAVLDYIYTGEVSSINKSDDPSDILQDLIYQLEVSNLWELDGLKAKLEHLISLNDLELIRPETVQNILEYAKDAKATALVRICKDYILKNREIVNRENAQN